MPPPPPVPIPPASSTAPVAPPAPVPAPQQPAAGPIKPRDLHQQAAAAYAPVEGYIARLRRREQVNGQDKPEEMVLFKFRKKPMSLYLKWLGSEGKGREVIYVQGQHDDKIHTLLAAGDIPLFPAGKRIALAPDNVFVRSASRYSITEAGIGNLIDRFGQLVEMAEKGDSRLGGLKSLGQVKRPEFETPVEGVEQRIPPEVEPQMPRGGRRLWFFDPTLKFPVLLVTEDAAQHEVEYYCYDRFQFPVGLDTDDFDPNKVWAKR